MFWILAIAIPIFAALVLCWPLLRRGGTWLGLGACLVLLVPVTTLMLYQGVGSPEGVGVGATTAAAAATAEDTDVETLLAQLRERLAADPENLEGWMLLGRSLKSMRRYDGALEAFNNALALSPDDAVVQVELAEAMIFASGRRDGVDPQVRELLQAAVDADPTLQKGLWLLGILEVQAGNDAAAIDYWQRLLPMLPPGSDVAASVEEQLAQARGRLGQSAEPAGPSAVSPAQASTEGAWPGLRVTITAPDLQPPFPDGAVLYLVARDPMAPRPPLGVVRVEQPLFPVDVTLDDGNAMMAARPVSGVARLEVLARLSLDGDPLPGPNDPASDPVTVDTHDTTGQLIVVLKPTAD
ncbi:tetratricopeptide repeat protein [Marinihelvus fidelis]|uniref:Tetratricopeptide repeat protein n=1 Tax=Marinihelvus fidelis TaxID=2613842 RepID=A0A5N0T670_9GAMM|nr:tetratricopeptide repeat protein [Marinihelvus fidelis]KAA9130560.1 tetratricopeptide repeat protein [Marinihelvus fidelis]